MKYIFSIFIMLLFLWAVLTYIQPVVYVEVINDEPWVVKVDDKETWRPLSLTDEREAKIVYLDEKEKR